MKRGLFIGGLAALTLAAASVVARARHKQEQEQDGETPIVPPPEDAVWLKPTSWTGTTPAPPSTGARVWQVSTGTGATQSLDAVAFLDERFAEPRNRPTRTQLGRIQVSFTNLGVQDDGKIYARPQPAAYVQAIALATDLDVARAPTAVGAAVRDFATAAYQLLPVRSA